MRRRGLAEGRRAKALDSRASAKRDLRPCEVGGLGVSRLAHWKARGISDHLGWASGGRCIERETGRA
eukprot:1376915-Alexandrium_andersonii.AAC.1